MLDLICQLVRSRWLLAVAVAGCLSTAGCNRGPAFGDVTGQVKLDGQAVEAGTIRFNPIDGATGSGGADIKDGQYEAKHVPVNKFRVEIHAVKVAGKLKQTVTDGMLPSDLIPLQYNAQSKLTCEIKEGNNTIDFVDLISK